MSSVSVPRPSPAWPSDIRRPRRPRWLLRVFGVSVGGLAVGVAIGLVLPDQPA